ncbi:hypothetical protein PF002_g24422 [Phytophthora fragariae]|nr:hypothetical protein PF002_g24422 [Phytophthora fragariae]KAE9276007.1 hypothetical protein PF001_g26335 [Phytophthora fragariae]
MVPLLAYSFMSRELTSGRIAGQAPALEKVQNSVKTWRGKNKPDRMEPVLEICRQSMYDGGAAERTSESLLVFCDTQVVDGAVQPALGTGSAANPFRIGLTCMALLESYVKVQRDPTLSTLLHLDSTHSIVKQKYPVFVMGISDRSGSFMPVVYYCTSLRKAQDIRWCLAFLKRVILHEFGLIFSPDFVMMDADKAQFKACEQEIQSTKILMCWFHVTQNVHKHVDGAKLSMITRKKIFRDLYGLHFAETEDDYLRKREFVVRSWRGAGALCLRVKRVMDHLLKLWILGARFAQWQAFHTPTGYATTNNPLETYHYTLKLVNDNKRATPSELVSGLDLSRLGYISSMSGFDNVPTVSKRLKAVFNRAEKLKELEAEVVHLHSLIVVRVWPKLTSTASVDEEETEDAPSANTIKNSYRSSNYRRLMWEGMPEGGWVVDPVGRSCKCPCWRKAGMCLHVIKATKVAHMHCPGMPPPALRFVSAARTNRGRSTHRQQQSSLSVGAVQLEPVEPVWLKAAALFRP